MTSEQYTILILSFIVVGFVLERTLAQLNLRNWSATIPEQLAGYYDPDKYSKARAYQLTNSRFSIISSAFSFVLIIVVLATGLLGWLDEFAADASDDYFTQAVVFFGVIVLVTDLVGLPFSLYGTFVIEERFGFNKTTIATFFMDKIKGYVLMAIIGGAILYALLEFYKEAGTDFWWYAWILVTVFMVVMMTLYASVILPMFNKLTPLEEGDLKDAIQSYCSKVGYDLKRIYVMDGSKRSTKANAFFSGLGRRKTIVLYDTLIDKHTTEELVAVLAHEIGHYKKKHTMQSLVLGVAQTGLMFYLLSLFLQDKALAEALGAERPSFHIGVVGFSFIYSPVSTITGLVMNVLSRKNEFEADAYARSTYDGEPLSQALKKLSSDNLGNPYPHPWYVFVYYSHPPLLKRLEALERA